MAKRNSAGQDFTKNSDGFDIAGGTTPRKLTLSGGDITVQGGNNNTYTYPNQSDTLVGTTAIQTLTNKRINPRVQTAASNASTITPNADTDDLVEVNGLQNSLTINAPTGTATNRQAMLFCFKDNGTARAITWNSIYVGYGSPLLSTTTVNKEVILLAIYNSNTSKWAVMPPNQEI